MKVFLTGASSGIGEALARFYAAKGATLGLLARREEHLRGLQSSLGVPVEIYPADVRELKAVRAAGEAFIAKHGVPDIVIANAGVSHGTLTEHEDDVEVFRKIMDINVNGLVNTFHPFIAPMRSRGSGSLVASRRSRVSAASRARVRTAPPRPRPSGTARPSAWSCAARASG